MIILPDAHLAPSISLHVLASQHLVRHSSTGPQSHSSPKIIYYITCIYNIILYIISCSIYIDVSNFTRDGSHTPQLKWQQFFLKKTLGQSLQL